MDEMETVGLSPNHISWSTLIGIYGGCGDVKNAVQSETEQRQHKASFYVEKEKVQEVMKTLFEHLVQRGIIGSIGAVAAGLDRGKEGPLVHIGACIASLIGQGGPDNYRLKWKWIRYFNNDRDRRDLITCGASSGVCVAFRAQLEVCFLHLRKWQHGGEVLFCGELFSAQQLWWLCLELSWSTANQETGLFGQGGLIMFDVSGDSVKYHVIDLIPITVIGIIGGVLGSLYNYLLHKVLRLYNLINEKGKLAKNLLSLSVSLFTSACLYGVPFLASCTPCDPSMVNSECPTM